MAKYVYSFNEGTKDMRTLLGVKGANLAEMTNMGLPVPFGFTITTEACNLYLSDGTLDGEIIDEIKQHLADLEEVMNKSYGDVNDPLLISVRAGAPVSMPGMMTTIVNLGLNDEAVKGFANKSANTRFAYDCYMRLIQSFGIWAKNIDRSLFNDALRTHMKSAGVAQDDELSEEQLKAVIADYKRIYLSETGDEFPQDSYAQLKDAIIAVFKSWNADMAVNYRIENDISDAIGTAVNVQSMVFGNLGKNSCIGYASSRNPETGEKKLEGEFLINSQGGDLRAGVKKPQPIEEMAIAFPEAYERFKKIAHTLENHFKDVQRLEFTVEDGKLFMMQTRVAKRTAEAAVKIAVDLANEGVIDEDTAVMRIDPSQIEQLLPEPDEERIAEIKGYTAKILSWADNAKTLKVRTNADNPKEAAQAKAFGAEGIGLIRTEHMFFEEERLPKMRHMVLSDSEEERRAALAELLEYQKEDFKRIYKEMSDMPVTIRLLDPPLRAFLPQNDEDIRKASNEFGIPYEKVLNKTLGLQQYNPMLGHRGGRLAVTYPEITEMQTEAIISSALEVLKEDGTDIMPEIMVPFISHAKELAYIRNTIKTVADRLIEESGEEMKYLVGTMIEVPRAAMTADEIAEEAEFFSFGTNDMTMMGFGLSRLDCADIIKEYMDKGIFEKNPFDTLDMAGVGSLMKMAVEGGKKTRANIKLGICGEHGGNPETIKFCHDLGLNYVSCAPHLVPIARLAAAHASISEKQKKSL